MSFSHQRIAIVFDHRQFISPLYALLLDPLSTSPALTVRVESVVSWQYGRSQPSGVVAEKKTEGEVAVTSKRGNTIKRKAEPDSPAVHVSRSGNDVVKKMSEVEVQDKANDEPKEQETTANGEEEKNTGEKRPAEDEPAEEEPAKKAKVGRGRPKKVPGAAPPKKAPATKKKTAPVEKKAATDETADLPVAPEPPAAAEPPAAPEPSVAADPPVAADPAKKGRGRPRKEEGTTTTAAPKPKAPKKEKKPRAVANGTGVGSRTRSAKK